MSDQELDLFTVTDLKQYIYCPRIFYYHVCLPDIRPVTHKMEAGIAAHSDEPKRAVRRTLERFGDPDGQREFEVAVASPALGLSGKIDEVVTTGAEVIPIDYKLAHKAGYHFQIQLVAYALLLEDSRATTITRGFLYLMPGRDLAEIPITPKLRRAVRAALQAMRVIAQTERMPAPTDWRQRCADCEFRRFCNDV